VDNFGGYEFSYEIHVYTGFERNTGTESKVSFTLAGTDGDTGTRKMEDGIRKVRTETDV